MHDEIEKVQFYLQKNIKKVIERKQGKYLEPCTFYDTITLKDSHNTYLLYWYIPNIKAFYYDDCKSRDKNLLSGSMLLTKDKNGQTMGVVYKKYKAQKEDTILWLEGMNVFTPHFFSRYRERMNLTNLSVMDLIATFSARNLNYFCQLDYNQIVLEKDRLENGDATAVKDGIMLGEGETKTLNGKDVLVVKSRTFLSINELKEDQASKNPSRKYVLEKAQEMFRKFNNL